MANTKVKLGNKPKTFEKAVEIVLLDESIADILIKFKYRTRSEFAALFNPEPVGPVESDAPIVQKTVVDWFKEADESNAEFVLKIAEGWDLDDKFCQESLLQLEDENPGALAAIALTYRKSVGEARVKNS